MGVGGAGIGHTPQGLGSGSGSTPHASPPLPTFSVGDSSSLRTSPPNPHIIREDSTDVTGEVLMGAARRMKGKFGMMGNIQGRPRLRRMTGGGSGEIWGGIRISSSSGGSSRRRRGSV